MRPRNEALLAVGALTALALLVAVLAWPRRGATASDERASSFLSGPGGTRGLLEATRALGIEVRRFRERPRELGPRLADGTRQLLAIIGPSYPFSAPERGLVVSFNQQADLLLAGEAASALMRCFGYRVRSLPFDSVRAQAPAGPGAADPWVHATLEPTRERVFEDSARAFDVGRTACTVPLYRAVDTLLLTPARRPVALSLRRADLDRRVILLADAELLRNRALRRTAAGPFALRLLGSRYRRVVFEEYHHGFGAQGSLAGAALAWSRRSPWGWAVWQLALVGLLALLFGAVRFGPARPAIPRLRRSPLEHVRALATALAAAQGHDEAIGAMVRGLRRRLAPAALRAGAAGDWRAWLTRLERPAAEPRAATALGTLRQLTRPGQPSDSVLRAANAVEDLWRDLKP